MLSGFANHLLSVIYKLDSGEQIPNSREQIPDSGEQIPKPYIIVESKFRMVESKFQIINNFNNFVIQQKLA